MGDYQDGEVAAERAVLDIWPTVLSVSLASEAATAAMEAALAEWGRCDCPDLDHPDLAGGLAHCPVCDGDGRVPFGVVPDNGGWRIVPLTVEQSCRICDMPEDWTEGMGEHYEEHMGQHEFEAFRSRLVGPWKPS